MRRNYIQSGDKVMILLTIGHALSGEVVYCPAQAGECWIIRPHNASDGDLVYVQTFMYISLFAAQQQPAISGEDEAYALDDLKAEYRSLTR